MKNITLQSVGHDGKIIKESNLVIQQSDRLVMKYGSSLTNQSIKHIHNYVKEALSNDVNLIAIPDCVELSILSIK